jgi:2-oxoglutarate dehydrogenase E1 component
MAKRRELEQTAFLYGGNSAFIEDLYARYLEDPAAVEASWRAYFDELGPDTRALFELSQAALQPHREEGLRGPLPATGAEVVDLGGERARRLIIDHLRVVMLIRAYRVRGHLLADLDPLGLARGKHHPELDPKSYGFSAADLDREFFLDNVLGLEKATLRRILEILPEGLDPGAHGRLAQSIAAEC